MQTSTRHAQSQRTPRTPARAVEPHLPLDRLAEGTWAYAPYGAMLAVADGALEAVAEPRLRAIVALYGQMSSYDA